MTAPLRVTAGVLRRGGRVLVAQRPPGKREALRWEFPGGKVEAGESDRGCLRRELREELGIEAEVGPLLVESRTRSAAGVLVLRSYLILGFTGEPLPLEHRALRWLVPSALPGLDMPAADGPVVARLQDPQAFRAQEPTDGASG